MWIQACKSEKIQVCVGKSCYLWRLRERVTFPTGQSLRYLLLISSPCTDSEETSQTGDRKEPHMNPRKFFRRGQKPGFPCPQSQLKSQSPTQGEREKLLSLLNTTSRWTHRSQAVRGQWREPRASELGECCLSASN